MNSNAIKRLAFAAILCGTLIYGCKNTNDGNGEILRKIKVTEAQKDSAIVKKTFPGIIREAREVNLAFRVGGPIKEFLVKPGDFVKEGQLIAEMDTRDYRIQADVAQAQYEQVVAETQRVKELYNRKSVTQAEYEKALAGEKMVAAQLKHAQDQLKDTRLYAPFSGYIQKVNYENGELVNTGMPIATLLDISSYEVETDIPASLVAIKESFISYTLDKSGEPTIEIPLKLKGFDRKAANNQLHTFYFTLNPALVNNNLPGREVNVNLYIKSNGTFNCNIPVKAVFYRDKKTFVWVYDPKESVVKSREVIASGITGNGNIRIEKGLESGELIVVAGVNVLKENQRVELLEEPAETNVGGLL
ncbi:MAG: efflux RND transporter periplasmic adaptor subunit [Bacteroidales bacterium]|nr:efflux RND transporter periplasmic adaptor subunit [Bacteroidales bacterium]